MSENEPTGQSNSPLTIIQRAGDRAIQIAQNFGEVIIQNTYSIFGSVNQVIAASAIFIACALAIGVGIWWINQPRKLKGEFNIAISKFNESTNDSTVDVAESAGQLIFSYLDGEYELSDFNSVDVAYYNQIEPVDGRQDAIDLMEKTNAHIVIYGDVNVIGQNAAIYPKFYVTEAFQFDVLSGRHEIELPVLFQLKELFDPDSEVNMELTQRMAILTEFTKGLVYFAAGDLALSSDAMETAITYVDTYGRFNGAEVIYLLASNNARLEMDFELSQSYLDEAFDINSNYGRAYIAQGNIYYDQLALFQAVTTYQQALTLEGQDEDAYIIEKASLNLGNIYTYQYQEIDRNPDALPEEKAQQAQAGLDSYQVVIDAFNDLARPEPRLQGMAAWAYYGSGIIYQVQGDFEKAAEQYQQALALSNDSDLLERANRRLQEVSQE